MMETPLMLAACYRRFDAVNFLIASGADVSLADWTGRTALKFCEEGFVNDDRKHEVTAALRNAAFLHT